MQLARCTLAISVLAVTACRHSGVAGTPSAAQAPASAPRVAAGDWPAFNSLVGEETLQREQRKHVFDDPYYRRWVQLNIVGDLGLRVPDVT
jgi:hypothetical protein